MKFNLDLTNSDWVSKMYLIMLFLFAAFLTLLIYNSTIDTTVDAALTADHDTGSIRSYIRDLHKELDKPL